MRKQGMEGPRALLRRWRQYRDAQQYRRGYVHAVTRLLAGAPSQALMMEHCNGPTQFNLGALMAVGHWAETHPRTRAEITAAAAPAGDPRRGGMNVLLVGAALVRGLKGAGLAVAMRLHRRPAPLWQQADRVERPGEA